MDDNRMTEARLLFMINGDWEYEGDMTFHETPKFGNQVLSDGTWYVIKDVKLTDDGTYDVYVD